MRLISIINENPILNKSLIVVIILIFALFLFTLNQYSGNLIIYILFSISSNLLLLMGFREKAIFFDAFIGVFCWLGFWLKTSIRISFMASEFYEETGRFNGSGIEFDKALTISSLGLLALILASLFREKYIFTYPNKRIEFKQSMLFEFYKNYRIALITIFFIFIFIIGMANYFLGIYQRGEIPNIILPFGGSGIFKWLLLFGLATGSALVLHFECNLKKVLAPSRSRAWAP